MLGEGEMKHAIIEIFYRKIIWISFRLTSEGVSVKHIMISFDIFLFSNLYFEEGCKLPSICPYNNSELSLSLSSFIFGNICLSLYPLKQKLFDMYSCPDTHRSI